MVDYRIEELKDIIREMDDIVNAAKKKIRDIPADEIDETLETFTEALQTLHRII